MFPLECLFNFYYVFLFLSSCNAENHIENFLSQCTIHFVIWNWSKKWGIQLHCFSKCRRICFLKLLQVMFYICWLGQSFSIFSMGGKIGKDPDSGKDWRQEEKGLTENEMVGWHHWFDGHEIEHALGVGDAQESLACCGPWDCKESDMTEWLNWTRSTWLIRLFKYYYHYYFFYHKFGLLMLSHICTERGMLKVYLSFKFLTILYIFGIFISFCLIDLSLWSVSLYHLQYF